MNPNLPSSFASAAAGQNSSRDARGARGDGRSSTGEWSRRDGRSNGTLTFRRSSTTPQATPSQAPPAPDSIPNSYVSELAPASSDAYHPDEELYSGRYSKEELLDIFRAASKNSADRVDVSRLFVDDWVPGSLNGHSTRGWGKPTDSHATQQEPDVCWNAAGDLRPVILQNQTSEEMELFNTDVNSTMKPPSQNKEGAHQGAGPNGRKASASHGSGNPYNVVSPTSARPSTRRRESLDPNPLSAGLTSPTSGGRFPRDDGGSWFARRTTDTKEVEGEAEQDDARDQAQAKAPGGPTRTNAPGNTGPIGSGWPPSNAASSSSVSGFGNFSLQQSGIGGKPLGTRGESRLAHLIPKDTSEPGTGKAGDTEGHDFSLPWRARPRTDTDPFGEDVHNGSSYLGGVRETSPTPEANQGGGAFDTPVKTSRGDLGMSSLRTAHGDQEFTPLSPSDTNPYRSPPHDMRDDRSDALFDKGLAHGATEQLPPIGSSARGGFPTGAFDGSDRSQTSSTGPRGYGNIASLSGWPATSGVSASTPDRERTAFGGAFGTSLFSPIGDLPSGGLGLGGVFGPPAGGIPGAPSLNSRSKLGSLFPAAMQAQMHAQDPDALADPTSDLRQANPLGAIGRGAIGTPARDTASPARSGQGPLEDLIPSSDGSRSHSMFTTVDGQPGLTSTSQEMPFAASSSPPYNAGPSGSDPQSAQVRQMVMPDRMRWVYLDPQGHVQGPFTGLEMNDWYKANFFTPDLRVKKLEDPDFEPLGQLIRRIGNSREPFLVPQIGIPHGPPPPAGPFAASTTSGIVPPLSGVFPSFGRTLTAEEQNNLERRKQEEQFMMAQQREFMMRQQAMAKFQMQAQGTAPSALHHHSSAHSLQSQPSFGNIATPIGIPPPGPIGPVSSGMYDSASAGGQGIGQGMASNNPDRFREDDIASLTTSERQMLAANIQGSVSATTGFPPGPLAMGGEHASGMRNQLPASDQLSVDSQGFMERLVEFEKLRAEQEEEAAMGAAVRNLIISDDLSTADALQGTFDRDQGSFRGPAVQSSNTQQHAQGSAANKSTSGLPMPFPPPNRSASQTPETPSASSAQPPPLAPWAKDPGEQQRGPSLKEIQESEARKAIKAEQAAAAARRIALEQEAAELREKEKAAVTSATPGLPTTSTWGQTNTPVNAASPWTKPTAGKSSSASSASIPTVSDSKKKKTLADIQREEEARKQKAAKGAAIQAGPTATGSASGKRYADLASKSTATGHVQQHTSPAPGISVGSSWSTVGAGGKIKAPTGPSSQTRVASAAVPKSLASKPLAKSIATPSNTASKTDATTVALDEFNKWLHRELGRGITGGIDIDTFAATLHLLPLETTIISDAVYSNSTTMDGRHFAEEFIRRKRLADKGIVEKQPSLESKPGMSSGGWNEVAKKSSHIPKDQGSADAGIAGAGFKVVPTKKRAGKK